MYQPANPNGQTPTESTAAPFTLPLTQDGTLQAILQALEQINTKLPLINAAAQLRVVIETVSATNVSTNLAQVNAQTTAANFGAAGAGTLRIIQAQETALPAINSTLQQIYQGIVCTGGPN